MKTFLLFVITLLILGDANAQITEVKISGGYAKIYNDKGSYSGKSIWLGKKKAVEGYNSSFVVVRDDGYAKIYDYKGSYTGKSIWLGKNKIVRNVSAQYILVKDGNYVKYYDFKGEYSGKSTYETK